MAEYRIGRHFELQSVRHNSTNNCNPTSNILMNKSNKKGKLTCKQASIVSGSMSVSVTTLLHRASTTYKRIQ